MSMRKIKRNKPVEVAQHDVAVSSRFDFDIGMPWRYPVLACLVAFAAVIVLLAGPRIVRAGNQIPVGSLTTYTRLSDSGLHSFISGGTASTVVVTDGLPPYTVIYTIPGSGPGGTQQDLDEVQGTPNVLVGHTTGLITKVNTVSQAVATFINNPAANYGILCRDSRIPGVDGWAYDSISGFLHQLNSNGTVTVTAAMPVGTAVELVEKAVDPNNPTPYDDYLLLVGTNAMGQVTVDGYDRLTGLTTPVAIWGTAPATATGITTSEGTAAFVSARGTGGAPGYLIHLDLTTMAFTPAPSRTFTTTNPVDVEMDGQWLVVLQDNGLGTGSNATIFDYGDGVNLIEAGNRYLGTSTAATGALSVFVDSAKTIDDLRLTFALTTTDAYGEEDLPGDRVDFTGATGQTVTVGTEPVVEPSPNPNFQEGLSCEVGCPPEYPGRARSGGQTGPVYSAGKVMYATGEEIYSLPIVSVPGVGIDLDLYLHYRSRRAFDFRYGQGWSFNHDLRTKTETNGDVTFFNGTGRSDTFVKNGGSFIPPRHYESTLAVGGGSTTLTTRDGEVWTFNGLGLVSSRADRYGHTISYTYAGDQLTTITDTLGRQYTLAYDATGRMSSITDFGGRVWTFEYDYLGQLVYFTTPATTEFPSGRTKRFSYSGNDVDPKLAHNLVHAWSALGEKVQTLTYDADDMVVAEKIGDDEYSFSYDYGTLTTTVIDRSSNTTKYTFDMQSTLTKREVMTNGLRVGEPVSFVTTHTANANGFIAHTVHPRGNRTDYTYDSLFNITEIRHKATNTASNSSNDIVYTYVYAGAHNRLSQSTDPNGNVTTYTVDAQGNTTAINRPQVTSPATQNITETFTYDTLGRITSATDGAGRQVSFTYYTAGIQSGYLQSVIRDPGGLSLTTTFAYDQYGNVTSVTDPKGNVSTITVDAENFVTEIQSPAPFSFKRKVTYDANRSVTKIEVENRDRKGVLDSTTPWITTDLDYDKIGRLTARTIQLTASVSATMSYEYEGSGRVSKVTTPEGLVTEFVYDERLLPFKVTRAPGTGDASTIQIDYDENGNVSKHTDALGNASTYTYDLYDRATQLTNALGHYVSRTYDKNGNALTVSAYDSGTTLQAKTSFSYDEVDRLWQVVQDRFGTGLTASFPTTTITHDAGGLRTQVSDPLSNATTWAYDAAGRLLTVTDAIGNKTDYTYDANGNVTNVDRTELPAAGGSEVFSTEFVHDELNRLTTIKEIDRLNTSNILTTSLEYDSRGNQTFRIDAEGNPQRWAYDLADRLTSYERALTVGSQIDDFTSAIEELFEYDADGRLDKVTDDNFNSTVYDYDALGRQIKTTYADTKVVQWSYDKNSNVKTRSDQNGTLVTNSFDALDRLISRSIVKGTGVGGTTLETFTYDALNRLLTAIDDDYQVHMTWDSVGNLLKEKQGYAVSGSEKWKTVTAGFTDAGSLSSLLYPSGFQVGHGRDAIYRLTSLLDVNAAVNVSTHTWQGRGRMALTTNQNGTKTEYTYDGFARVATIDHLLAGGGSLHKFEYLYDKVHNRRMEKNTFSAAWIATLPAAAQAFLNGRAGKGDVYAYDKAYRLVDVRHDTNNPATEVASPGTQTYAKLVQFTMDGLGNRSQVTTTAPPGTPGTVTYAVDVVNQYTAVGGVTRAHDNNGNLTDDGTQLYVYDYENHLIQVKTKSSGASVATYKYDPLGRRVEKAVVGGGTTRYILSGQSVVEEYDGGDNWQARYIHEDRIDHPRAMDRADIADVDGDANTVEVQRFHYHQQALGSVTELTMSTGAVVEWATYDVYGKPTIRGALGTVIGASAVGNPFGFTGRENDAESALMHYRARAYDPERGRFLQRDPLGYIDGPNDRAYVGDRVATARDPLGLETTDASSPHGGGGGAGPQDATADALREAIDAAMKEYDESLEGAREEARRDMGRASKGQVPKRTGGGCAGEMTVAQFLEHVLQTFNEAVEAAMEALMEKILEAIEEIIGPEASDDLAEVLSPLAGLTELADGLMASIERWVEGRIGPAAAAALMLALRTLQNLNTLNILRGLGRAARKRCFVAGTEVATSDGLVPIEDVEVGDLVLSWSEEEDTWGWQAVVGTFSESSESVVVTLTARGETISSTAEHPFWVGRGACLGASTASAPTSLSAGQGPSWRWRSAGRVRPGDYLWSHVHGAVLVDSASRKRETLSVFNLEVADSHTYAVTSSLILTHNTCRKRRTPKTASELEIPGTGHFEGRLGPEGAARHLGRFHGIDRDTFRERLHRIKKKAGLRPDEDVIIGRTGDVYDAATGEPLGSLTDPAWGGGRRR